MSHFYVKPMRKFLFLSFCFLTLVSVSQTLTTLTNSITACYSFLLGTGEAINGLNGTASNATLTTDRINNVQSAYALSGSTLSYIQLPNSPLIKPGNDITFSAWIKPATVAASHIVFARNSSTLNIEAYQLAIVSTTAGFRFQASKASPTNYDVATGTGSIAANTWYHVAFTMDNNSVRLFVNGVHQASVSASFAGFDYVSSNVYLGGSNDPLFNMPFDGVIDNVKFYNRALAPAEVYGLFNVDPSCVPVPPVNCEENYYRLIQTPLSIMVSNWGIPNISSTTTIIPPLGSFGFAIGPSFGFNAPNPTYWVIANGTYWYHNGYYFVDTGHTSNGVSMGGGQNYLYSIGSVFVPSVSVYNGSGNDVFLMNPVVFGYTGIFDVVSDDLDNYYLFQDANPQSLKVYNSAGVQTCSYSINGLPSNLNGATFAMRENTVTVILDVGSYYVGTIAGSAVNFTQTPLINNEIFTRFGNCKLKTAFSSSISASSVSVSCFTPTVTLTANSVINAANFVWSGPGIISSNGLPNIQVNQPGVYTCSLISCPGGTSYCTYTVLAGPLATTPTIASTGSINCITNTVALSVLPNTPSFSSLWSGYGVTNGATTPTATINAGGTYSIAITNTLTGCVGTQTIFVPSILMISQVFAEICEGGEINLWATGMTNYSWSPVVSTQSQIPVSPSVTTVYTVTGSDGLGCTLNAYATLSVINTSITLSASSPSICLGGSVNLSVSGASNYTWLPGGSNATSITVSPTVTTNYVVVGYVSFCQTSRTYSVAVDPGPVLNPAKELYAICEGQTNTITASNAVSYTWQPGNQQVPVIYVSPSVTTIYTVSGTSAGGCVASATTNLIVDFNPTITISPASTTVCAGSFLYITGNGGNYYEWGASPGSGFYPAASGSYTFTGYNNACPGTAVITITLLPVPTVTVADPSLLLCRGSSTILTAVGSALSYSWMPGSFTGTAASVSPTLSTTYTVTGTNSVGCTANATATVSVDYPTMYIGPPSNTVCANNTLLMVGVGAVSYTWNPGGVISSSITATPSLVTTYSLTGATVNGCTNTIVKTLIAVQAPTLFVSASPSLICSGNLAVLSASGAAQFSWSAPGSIVNTMTVSPTGNTDYTVTGTAPNGCENTAVVSVSVNATPVITAVGSGNFMCSGAVLTLSASGAGNYTWSPGGVVGSTVSVAPLTSTTYTVSGSLANCNSSQFITISVNPNPVISVPNATLCSGTSTILFANGATSYTWQPVNLLGSSVTLAPITTTEYTVSGTNSFGCSATTTATVLVNATPTLTAIASPTAICSGTSANLNASGAATYSWNPGSLNTASITVSPSASTVYSLVGISSAGCKDTKTISVGVNANPVISVQGIKEIICSGATITLVANGAGTYTWNNVVVSSSFTDVPLISTIYTVTGTSMAGCTSSYSVMQQVSECTNLIGVARDGDKWIIYPNPSNGEFHVSSGVAALQQDVSIEVYNTLGQLLLNQKSGTSDLMINLSDYANGTYLLLIQETGKSVTRALVVKQ